MLVRIELRQKFMDAGVLSRETHQYTAYGTIPTSRGYFRQTFVFYNILAWFVNPGRLDSIGELQVSISGRPCAYDSWLEKPGSSRDKRILKGLVRLDRQHANRG
jgi:hypothetical protein